MAIKASDIIREKIKKLKKENEEFQQLLTTHMWSSCRGSVLKCIENNKKEIRRLQKLLDVTIEG